MYKIHANISTDLFNFKVIKDKKLVHNQLKLNFEN